MTTTNPELKACPFCYAELTHRDGSYKHPNNECYLCAIVIFPPQYNEWNRRYAATGDKTVINDAGLAEAVSNAQGMINCRNAMKSQIFPDINDGLNKDISTLKTLINHVVKGEKAEKELQIWKDAHRADGLHFLPKECFDEEVPN